jgi:hypothetical protein
MSQWRLRELTTSRTVEQASPLTHPKQGGFVPVDRQ